MLCVVVAEPTNSFVIAVAPNENAHELISREQCFADNYLEFINKALLGHPIDKIIVFGSPQYIMRIMEEIKFRFPQIPIEGNVVLINTNGRTEHVGEKKDEE